jgi:hypothetical protein
VTPTEEGTGTRRKRGDSKDSSGASGDEIQDDDKVEPSNASGATKFAIKKQGERATEAKGNAVAYMATRIVKFVKNTLFKMVKFISDDELL